MKEKIREELYKHLDSEYGKFNKKLCPDTKREILGIRIPILRKIAKEFVKNQEHVKYLEEVLHANNDKYFEEVILQGLIIGYAKFELQEKLVYIKLFVSKIDSWLISDTFIPTLKIKDKDLKEVWDFILPYTKSNEEFEVRFAVIMMLDYFINDEYVNKVINIIDEIENDKYYAQMAIAWTIAEIGIKFPNKAFEYLNGENNLDKFTYNKSLQKMIESYRVRDEIKDELRKMKRK